MGAGPRMLRHPVVRLACCADSILHACSLIAAGALCVRAHPGRTGKGPLVASPRDARGVRN
eukprot:7118336-Prymnesium_polylepis.1